MTTPDDSAFETALTVRQVIDSIYRNEYLLPGIQREFVWDDDQIVRLFDSLMRRYPIGSFLFWNVEKQSTKLFQFYEFMKKYHERDYNHNPRANVTGNEKVTSILDGQQRFTALYIGLKGTYADKIRWKRRSKDAAFPTRKLYLNLRSKSKVHDMLYDFQFLTTLEATNQNENVYWYEVGEVLEYKDLKQVYNFLRDSKLVLDDFATDCLTTLFDVINRIRTISYYLEKTQDLNRVLDIFIRVNSAGEPLSSSDLLLSIATAQWKTKDAREEITGFVDSINKIGEDFKFNKDFVLKSCLYLSDIADIAFKVSNFNTANMLEIEKRWEDIKKTIRLSVELTSSLGFNSETLVATYSVIPIAYYIMKLGNPESFAQSLHYRDDREKIGKWLRTSLIKRALSGQPDSVLNPERKIISKSFKKGFPLKAIEDRFKGTNRTLIFTDDDLQGLLKYKYKEKHTFSVLSLLYPTLDYRNRFHKDHIFPRSFFKKSVLKKKGIPEADQDFFLENCDHLGNLQLLEGLINEEKLNIDFKRWLEKTYPSETERTGYLRKNYIPLNVDLEFRNFKEVFEKRNSLILEKLRETLL